MEHGAALTLGIALAAGVVAQIFARHVRLPGIVLLLATGVVLGPDVAGVVRPERLGPALSLLVGFAVAIILFEGGLNLQLGRLRREAKTIRRLVTTGALITMAGGALSAHLVAGWDWPRSILFGALVIVTGPTVVTPLLRRIKVRKSVATILEAEGVLIDPIGVIVAVVTLEIVLDLSGESLAAGLAHAAISLATGAAIGVAGGGLLALALRSRALVPDGLENIFTLASVLALYQFGEAIAEESGVAVVTVAGVVVGNVRTRVQKDLLEFKEQLTILMIGALFVLLAADVRLADVRALGWPGLLTVASLMFVVRPLQVFVCTAGTGLGLRQKLFLSWIAPRGIVAAAVASLFAESLNAHGMPGGAELRALVFLVIGVTVLVQGSTGALVASLLRLRRPRQNGWVILGANPLARALARVLQRGGEEVVLIDANPDLCEEAEAEGLRVLFGNGLHERTLVRAEIDTRRGAIALTPNDEVNLLFAKTVHEEAREPRLLVALRRGHRSVLPEAVHDSGGLVLFGEPRMIEMWSLRLERGLALAERRVLAKTPEGSAAPSDQPPYVEGEILSLAVERGQRIEPIDETTRVRPGDVVHLLVFSERADEAHAHLEALGWRRVEERESVGQKG